jgi:hypothetical protein
MAATSASTWGDRATRSVNFVVSSVLVLILWNLQVGGVVSITTVDMRTTLNTEEDIMRMHTMETTSKLNGASEGNSYKGQESNGGELHDGGIDFAKRMMEGWKDGR